jgi:hypothetical protein
MKIEVLYFDGCPNHKPAVERVQELLHEEGVSAEVLEVNVSDASIAQEVGFLGSPSVRVNGLDVEPGARTAREYGMMCRSYSVDGRREGFPSREMLGQAIREANSGLNNLDSSQPPSNGSRSPTSLPATGSAFAAITPSFCCILPIVFALTGFSILGASALFDAWRPYLLGLTFGLLGLGFYFAYRPKARTVRSGLSLRDPGYQSIGASDALACDCGRCLVCVVSVLLGRGREVEILRLVARGYNNREIADALSIAEGTVKNYISSSFENGCQGSNEGCTEGT